MKHFYFCFYLLLFTTCTSGLPMAEDIACQPGIFPDYKEVTIPNNIAPLNFKLDKKAKSIVLLKSRNFQIRIDSNNGVFEIPPKKWRKLLSDASGEQVICTIYVLVDGLWSRYMPFLFYVVKEPIDPYLVYRKIAPGYRMWGEMGIYQRSLETFNEKTILSNRFTNNNCMNCHSFCMQDPNIMLFHQRSTHGGTYIIRDGEIEKLNTKTDKLTSALVYPAWHPSGRYVAFSVNDTKQDFHFSDPNRIEVFDLASDVVIYDVENHEVMTNSLLFSDGNMNTFPSFSPDGKRLFFCSAEVKPMPESFREIKYNLMSVSFDPDNGAIGEKIDTLYNAVKDGRSAKFPRVSPDGRYLMYTLSDYGNFSIWHKDADLQMVDLRTGTVDLLQGVNSSDVESYHSWSSNSRWFVFSSRRNNGLYSCPYLCYIDEQGVAGKPFLLPQRSADFYDSVLFSFNIPELIKGKVELDTYELIQISKYGAGKTIDVLD